MGHTTGAAGGVDVHRTGSTGSLSDPRSRLQVHGRFRCHIRGRKHPDRSDTDSSTRSEWDCRAVRPDSSIRVPGLAVDPERPGIWSAPSPCSLIITTVGGLIAAWT